MGIELEWIGMGIDECIPAYLHWEPPVKDYEIGLSVTNKWRETQHTSSRGLQGAATWRTGWRDARTIARLSWMSHDVRSK